MGNKHFFRSDVVKCNTISAGPNQEVILGAAVVTKGVTHDERGEFDDAALNKVIELGNAVRIGIKSRFGHPNMSGTALGTFLGRFKNFRLDGDVVRADLYIDPSAHKTPDGDLAQYVIDLSNSDSQAFGTSMVIDCRFERKKDDKGKELNDPPPLIIVDDLFSVDVVDDPAANNSFFGKQFFSDSVRPSAEMTVFLDKFLNQPDSVDQAIAFLQRYQTNSIENEDIKNGRVTEEDQSVRVIKEVSNDTSLANAKIQSEGGEIPMTEQKKEKLEEEQKPVEETPAAETPAVETPAEEEAPAEEKPAEETPAVEEPAVETPAEGADKKFTQAELDQAINRAVTTAILKKDKETASLALKVDDLQRRLDESEADSAVEKLWNEKYSSLYSEEDEVEIKGLLKKMQLGQSLTVEEMNAMIDKKEVQDEKLSNSSETITSKGISSERKAELITLGGIKTKKEQPRA